MFCHHPGSVHVTPGMGIKHSAWTGAKSPSALLASLPGSALPSPMDYYGLPLCHVTRRETLRPHRR